MDRQSRSWAALSIIGIAAGAPLHHHKKSPAEAGLRAELRRNRRDSKETPQTIDFPGIVARKAPLRSGAKEGQSARGLSFRAAWTTRESRPVPALRSGSNPTVRLTLNSTR